MTSRVVLLSMLTAAFKGCCFGWSDSAIYGTSCDAMVSGCPSCVMCVESCWEPYFLSCSCIPDELKSLLNEGFTLDGGAICIWSLIEGLGEPTCCEAYKRSALPIEPSDSIPTNSPSATKKSFVPTGGSSGSGSGSGSGWRNGNSISRIFAALLNQPQSSGSSDVTQNHSGCY